MKTETIEIMKQIGDSISVVTAIGTLIQILPAVAALFTIIWTGMRMAELITGKEFSVLVGMKKVIDDAEP